MYFPIPLLVIFLSLGNLPVSFGVNLHQYTRPRCYGNRAWCNNIGSRVCCQARNRVFASGSCQGCTSTDFHTTWNRVGNNYCGRAAASTNGGRCISGGSNLRGHTWCRLCRTRAEAEEAPCTETLEPDVLEIGGRMFYLNESVPEDHRDRLWQLWGDEVPVEDVPSELMQYA
ncbi:hypothetical protein ATEIFO6365_0005068800 [Aspergillus terreus]|uniref:Uncharacterized protein n=1 Tax=Aspergillus terreus TaxID=33178 RepID=A0A5M3Z1J1_ASPTE|nr:hypothetical protein ATETN484_0007052900 [Aspergillus terreus]GFF16496.1 hypothetical protein ATEIFO6365_0005068800 [Aspergillus terreus]